MFALLVAIIYISFISLGLPDSLLGSAWPVMQADFGVPLSFAGIISMIICVGTIISSLLSERLTKKFGTGVVTAVSVCMTAAALFLFSISTQFWMLILCAIPYGLGAGGVDASLNNYVALHLKARHMSWLHCMWGVGAAVSPYIMGYAINGGSGWNQGYLIIAIIQICLSATIFISLPLWKKPENRAAAKSAAKVNENTATETANSSNSATHVQTYTANTAINAPAANHETFANAFDKSKESKKAVSLKEIFKIKGAAACFICFFCYCALEQTTMLWASSFMISHNGLSAEEAAQFASLFFIGITVGRGVNGFLTLKFSDKALIRAGQVLISVGIVFIVIPDISALTVTGFIILGLGCAPIYPSIIHMTPALFGEDKSQAMIGVQMASAYVGSCIAPPLFGLIANHITQELLPLYLAVFLVLMLIMHEITQHKAKYNQILSKTARKSKD
ncbi:MAG: MFS transporter [Clostridia bacterium]|nr:MFS transporter [Clostridia bacterium]